MITSIAYTRWRLLLCDRRLRSIADQYRSSSAPPHSTGRRCRELPDFWRVAAETTRRATRNLKQGLDSQPIRGLLQCRKRSPAVSEMRQCRINLHKGQSLVEGWPQPSPWEVEERLRAEGARHPSPR